jgi:trk system potassium uptake protein TrkA
MNILICGAGDVGSHTAESLADDDHSITVIDLSPSKLEAIEDTMDVRTLVGNCAEAAILREAGVARSDMVVAATDVDEINLLTAAIAKGLGAARCVARVHHSAFFEQRGLDYQRFLHIDRLICPEYATALAIARKLRNPGAMAIEEFARGAVEMQQFPVSKTAPTVGKSLSEISLPRGTRLAGITRKGGTFVPDASTSIDVGDTVILVGNADVFHDARRLFYDKEFRRRKIAIMGGSAMSVWLCRALQDRSFSIRLFESERTRAEELAEKLDWVTVIHGDPTDATLFNEENLAQVDVFIPLLQNDNANIIAGVLGRTRGIEHVLTVVQNSKFLDIVFDIGIDDAFSPRQVAADEIDSIIDESPLRLLGSLAEGFVDVFRVRVADHAPVLGKPLKQIKLSPDWVVAAVQRDGVASVPSADDTIERGDTVLVIGRHDKESTLKKFFVSR